MPHQSTPCRQPPPKQPYSHFKGDHPQGMHPPPILLPPSIPHALRLCHNINYKLEVLPPFPQELYGAPHLAVVQDLFFEF
jgi:hypothetical protein